MPAEPLPNILIVSASRALHAVGTEWQRGGHARVVLCESAAEAEVILHDIRFIGTALNGVVVEYRLPDKSGCRFVAEQRDNFPECSFALVSDFNNTALNMWARAFQVLLLIKPVLAEDLHRVLLPPPELKPLGVNLDLHQEIPAHAARS